MASTGTCCNGTTEDTTREASAVFDKAQELQAAAEQLLGAGFTHADISVLGSEAALRAKFGGKVPNASELAANPDTPRAALVSSGARTEGLAAIAGIPVYVGGAGAAAVAALEGATALATAGAAVGVGLAAGALGLYVEHRMAKRHSDQIDKHLKNGGLVLWVRTDDSSKEMDALKLLRKSGAQDIRVHTVTQRSGVDAVPFHDAQPDPFLKIT
jgi:outer membrane lipoprotein SlyB